MVSNPQRFCILLKEKEKNEKPIIYSCKLQGPNKLLVMLLHGDEPSNIYDLN